MVVVARHSRCFFSMPTVSVPSVFPAPSTSPTETLGMYGVSSVCSGENIGLYGASSTSTALSRASMPQRDNSMYWLSMCLRALGSVLCWNGWDRSGLSMDALPERFGAGVDVLTVRLDALGNG